MSAGDFLDLLLARSAPPAAARTGGQDLGNQPTLPASGMTLARPRLPSLYEPLGPPTAPSYTFTESEIEVPATRFATPASPPATPPGSPPSDPPQLSEPARHSTGESPDLPVLPSTGAAASPTMLPAVALPAIGGLQAPPPAPVAPVSSGAASPVSRLPAPATQPRPTSATGDRQPRSSDPIAGMPPAPRPSAAAETPTTLPVAPRAPGGLSPSQIERELASLRAELSSVTGRLAERQAGSVPRGDSGLPAPLPRPAAATRAERPLPLAAPPMAAVQPPGPGPAAPPPQVIHVTIGRIEVRAAAAPTAPEPRRTSPAQPRVTLEDYLRRRNGGIP